MPRAGGSRRPRTMRTLMVHWRKDLVTTRSEVPGALPEAEPPFARRRGVLSPRLVSRQRLNRLEMRRLWDIEAAKNSHYVFDALGINDPGLFSRLILQRAWETCRFMRRPRRRRDDLSVRQRHLKQQQVYRYFNRITRSLARAPRDAVDEPGS